MNFQTLLKVEEAQFFLDCAFKHARERVIDQKEKIRTKAKRDPVKKAKATEQTRIRAVERAITSRFDKIIQSFPSIDNLPEFYYELIKITIDYALLKRSLGAVNWSSKRTTDMARFYEAKVMKSHDEERVKQASKEFYGRVSSIVKQISKNLLFLEEARKTMKRFPAVKTSLYTVALFGFPNIGKTTLLGKLTGSKPEIKNYAFTTKSLNMGYFTKNGKKIQVIDTPGTLNRFDKMNYIEQQAHLALKHCADLIVYIIDLTEPYPLKDQQKLRKQLVGKEVIVYLTKKDIIDKKIFESFKKDHYIDSPEELKKEILSRIPEDGKKPSPDEP